MFDVMDRLKVAGKFYSAGDFVTGLQETNYIWDEIPEPKTETPHAYHVIEYGVAMALKIGDLDEARKWASRAPAFREVRHDCGEVESLAGRVAFEGGEMGTARENFITANKKSGGRMFQGADPKYRALLKANPGEVPGHGKNVSQSLPAAMNQEFYDAATFGDFDVVREMLASAPSLVSSTTEGGFTALHGVAGEEQEEMAELLLNAGADPNASNDEGIMPLHLAASADMVELLIRHGAEINGRTHDGRTPLIVHAAELEGIESMEALLECGADAGAVDAHGNTARSIAASREEEDKVNLLLDYLKR
jgi:uncharacterized protein